MSQSAQADLVSAPQRMPHNVDNWWEATQARLAVNTTMNVFVIECSDFVWHSHRQVVHQFSTRHSISMALITTLATRPNTDPLAATCTKVQD